MVGYEQTKHSDSLHIHRWAYGVLLWEMSTLGKFLRLKTNII